MFACLAWFSGAQWDRAQHHHGEETCPPAPWCHWGNRQTLRQWLADRWATAVSPPDLRDPTERLRTHRYSGRTFQWGKKKTQKTNSILKPLVLLSLAHVGMCGDVLISETTVWLLLFALLNPRVLVEWTAASSLQQKTEIHGKWITL